MAKRIASTLLTIIMFLFSFSSIAFALPANVADKTIVVDFAEGGPDGIQTAINSILDLEESDKGGWTIVVGGGTYDRFTVPSALTDLTIQAAENAQVIIHTLRQEEPPVSPQRWRWNQYLCQRDHPKRLDGSSRKEYPRAMVCCRYQHPP